MRTDLIATTTDPTPATPAAPGGLVLAVAPAPDTCPATLYVATDLTTAASRRGMASNLRRAARVLSGGTTDDPTRIAWANLRHAHVAALRAALLEEGASPATVNAILSGVKGVMRQTWRLGYIDADTLARAIDVRAARGSRVDRTGRELTQGEVRALFAACAADTTAAGARDAAVLALALGAGLRRAELCSLTVADYTPDYMPEQGLGRLVVAGKGHKERAVLIHNGALDALHDWLAVRGSAEGPLFQPVNKGGAVGTGGLTGAAVAQALAKRGEQAGVAAFTPHDCRRTYVTGLLDNGVDISTVADLAGHASVETTRIYDRRGERAAAAAAGTVHLPYTRRTGGAGA